MISCKKSHDSTPPIDKIRLALSTSIVVYDAATAGSWVHVTGAEYNNLLITVTGSARYASPESYMNTSAYNDWSPNLTIGGNNNDVKVPASSYIIGWSLRTGDDIGANSANSKLKLSLMQGSGYADYGGGLPSIGTIAKDTRIYFILKKTSY